MTDGIVGIIKTILEQAKEFNSDTRYDSEFVFGTKLGYEGALEDLIIFLEDGNRNGMHKPEYYCDLQPIQGKLYK